MRRAAHGTAQLCVVFARSSSIVSSGARTVAEIAAAWGFAHAGRFSAEYARRFGEAPSTTLRS